MKYLLSLFLLLTLTASCQTKHSKSKHKAKEYLKLLEQSRKQAAKEDSLWNNAFNEAQKPLVLDGYDTVIWNEGDGIDYDTIGKLVPIIRHGTRAIRDTFDVNDFYIDGGASSIIPKNSKEIPLVYDSSIYFKVADSVEKVKGWIRYWKSSSFRNDGSWYSSNGYNGGFRKTKDSVFFVFQVMEPATAVYSVKYVPCECPQEDDYFTSLVLLTGCRKWQKTLVKILFDGGKEFDITKRYEFIEDDKIVR